MVSLAKHSRGVLHHCRACPVHVLCLLERGTVQPSPRLLHGLQKPTPPKPGQGLILSLPQTTWTVRGGTGHRLLSLSLWDEIIFLLSPLLPTPGYREGFLWKRGRDNGQFLNRKFILTEGDGILKYFTKTDAKVPKAMIKVDNINATFQPTKIGNPNGLQLMYLKDNSTRNIFVYHDEEKEIVDWFNAIRAIQFHYLKVAFPGASDQELKHKLTRNFLKEGYMEKTGPKQTEGFKKRWFSLDHRRLMYFKDPLDAYARGEVFIGSSDNGYVVKEGLPPGTPASGSWQHGITIVTPDRDFLFICETEQDRQEWVSVFNGVMAQQMSPQEYTVEAYFKHRR
ncbi:arf-GAP with dual PH domain-containing protein 1-like [Amblyraja radiata]|uniref:arf-GAP with dual PH domain-containing protein 1-like n=1 Tax=Amblyraja radiata TaxID=386614 RepID=UPI0014037FA2|nr:arf-GAP with dual PH domain-containing protein 1-like [Amblyraja radiata]